MGKWCYSFIILGLDIKSSNQLHATAALLPAKQTTVPIRQEAGWAPEPVFALRNREKFQPYRKSNLGHPVHTYTD
jgi:hypothetical protein